MTSRPTCWKPSTGSVDMRAPSGLRLEVVVPVHNEQDALEQSIRVLHATLSEQFDEPWRITIADNASTDGNLLLVV